MRAKPLRLILPGLAVLTLGACTSGPVHLNAFAAAEAGTGDSKSLSPATCGIYLEKVDDLRSDKQDMGNIAGNPVSAADMIGWVKSSVSQLRRDGYRIDDQRASGDDLTIDVELLKAYMLSITTSKSAVLVVRVIYKRADATVLTSRVYRGTDTSMDWAGTEGETNSAFQRAAAQVLSIVQPDMHDYCITARAPVTSNGT